MALLNFVCLLAALVNGGPEMLHEDIVRQKQYIERQQEGMENNKKGVEAGIPLMCDTLTTHSCPAPVMNKSILSTSFSPEFVKDDKMKEKIEKTSINGAHKKNKVEQGKDNIQKEEKIRFCNIPDEDDKNNDEKYNTTHYRHRRYTLHGKKWDKTTLTWTLRTPSRHTSRLNVETIKRQLIGAMRVWEEASTLRFIQVQKDHLDVDIYVDFLVGNHGDGYAFDGQGRTLAHAFYPGGGLGGDMHFDDEEMFVRHEERESGKNSLLITAAHELGHSLGLRHSDVSKALMAPFYQDFSGDFKLPQDDTLAIQVLYGRPKTDTRTPMPTPPTRTPMPTPPTRPPPRPTRPPTHPTRPNSRTTYPPPRPTRRPQRPTRPPQRPTRPPQRPSTSDHPPITHSPMQPPPRSSKCPPQDKPKRSPAICLSSVDAATEFRGELLFFKGHHYWRITRTGHHIPSEYPAEIKSRFSPMTHVDAAYVDNDDNLHLFHASHFFTYNLDRAFQIVKMGNLSDLHISATRINAAMVWGHNGRVYVFSKEKYWRLGRDGTADLDYPRDMAVWRDVPENFSAAFTRGYKTFFLAGLVFWEFDSMVMRAQQPPLLIAPHWMNCPNFERKEIMLCSSGCSCAYISICIVALWTSFLI